MPKLPEAVPDYVECVTVCADADDGQRAAAALGQRLAARGIYAEIVASASAMNRDANDVLRERGVGGLRDAFDQAPRQKPNVSDTPPHGVQLQDFYAYMPEHRYIFVPTGQVWPSLQRRCPRSPPSATSRRPPGSTATAPSSR